MKTQSFRFIFWICYKSSKERVVDAVEIEHPRFHLRTNSFLVILIFKNEK